MISRFFTKTITVKRHTWSGDSSSLQSEGTVSGHLQQGTDENYQEQLGLRFTKPYTVWCGVNEDIVEGDRLTIDGEDYDVRYVVNRDVGSNQHLMALLEKL